MARGWRIGVTAEPVHREPAFEAYTDDPLMLGHAARPWVRGWVADREGAPLAGRRGAAGVPVRALDRALARHSFCVGKPGSGKTRIYYHLVREQLKGGASAVVIEAKAENLGSLVGAAEEAGIPPERVWVASLAWRDAVPGWNVLAADDPWRALSDFMEPLRQQYEAAWGPRLDWLLTNALVVVTSGTYAGMPPSVYELYRFMTDPAYRKALLALPPERGDRETWELAARVFREDFDALSERERKSQVAPVTNKLGGLVLSAFLRRLLCAPGSEIDLPSLWKQPGLAVFQISGRNGPLLAGMLAYMLLEEAKRQADPEGGEGRVPVILGIDELGHLQGLLKQSLMDILAVARSGGVRLMLASQYFGQLAPDLRQATMSACQFQAYFNLESDEAAVVAKRLALGYDGPVSRAEVAAGTGRTVRRYDLVDGHGGGVRLNGEAWERLRWGAASADGRNPVAELAALAEACGVPLYVRDPHGGGGWAPEHYAAGLGPGEYWLEGPDPLRLAVSFPRPRASGVRRLSETDERTRWTREIAEMATQRAVVVQEGRLEGIVAVDRVEYSRPSPAYLEAVRRRREHGYAPRQAEADRLASGKAPEAERPEREGRPARRMPRRGEVTDGGFVS